VFYLLLGLMILDALLLIPVVLLQSGKGGGLAAMGGAAAGSDTLFGGRQAATLLTKATWWAGGIFLGLALVLSLVSSRTRESQSILREGAGAPLPTQSTPAIPGTRPVAPAPATPGQVPPSDPQTPANP
jgi:preprotein translocase subunit SecG